jgi:hypothetical protein
VVSLTSAANNFCVKPCKGAIALRRARRDGPPLLGPARCRYR